MRTANGFVLVAMLTAWMQAASAQDAPPIARAPDAAAVTSALRALVPAGVTVNELRQEGDKFVFSGNTATNAQLSNYMRTVDATPGLEGIELREIAADATQYRYVMSIEVNCAEREATRPGAVCGAPAKAQSVHKCRVDGTVTFQAAPCPAGSEL